MTERREMGREKRRVSRLRSKAGVKWITSAIVQTRWIGQDLKNNIWRGKWICNHESWIWDTFALDVVENSGCLQAKVLWYRSHFRGTLLGTPPPPRLLLLILGACSFPSLHLTTGIMCLGNYILSICLLYYFFTKEIFHQVLSKWGWWWCQDLLSLSVCQTWQVALITSPVSSHILYEAVVNIPIIQEKKIKATMSATTCTVLLLLRCGSPGEGYDDLLRQIRGRTYDGRQV